MTIKIRPKVNEDQMLDILEAAELVGEQEAIKQFKKTHTVRNRRWVKRKNAMTKEKIEKVVPVEAETDVEVVGEGHYVPMGVISFAQLKAEQEAEEVAENVKELTEQYVQLLWNVMFSADTADKIAGLKTLSDEFAGELQRVLSTAPSTETEALEDGLIEGAFTETFKGVSMSFAEAGEDSEVAYLFMQPIEPGWGNTRDNHYYPKEMLERDAGKFVGAKMYETDHNQAEKSTRTWVSSIKAMEGFTESGAPIAKVAIIDKDFEQKLRKLAKADMLGSMECSIMAAGKARKGFELDGRKGNVVEAITDVASVDWVTKAGAGGKALSLAESEVPVDEKEIEKVVPQEETPAEEPVIEAEAEAVIIKEQEVDEEPLAAEVVKEVLAASNLPKPSLKRLSEGTYEDTEALEAAIAYEVSYIKELSGSGKPFGLSESDNEPKPVSVEELNTRKDEVNKKYLR